MYKLVRSILFLFPAEFAHYFSMNCLRLACKFPFIRSWLKKSFSVPGNHPVNYFNLSFPNLVGLGAGFDKNAKYLSELDVLGFGFVEIGTVTPLPQAGNPKPRLFRLPKDKALINRMGFNNDGVKVIANRLRKWKGLPPTTHPADHSPLIIGGNIGKNKQTPNEDAWKDYETCFNELHDCVDYFVVNVSSPNTPGLRELQEKSSLRKILQHLQMINSKMQKQKPILLKIAPDLSTGQLEDVIGLAQEIKLDGLVVSNTTLSRKELTTSDSRLTTQTGGLSGLPLKYRNTEIIRHISEKTNRSIPIIASGGIFTSGDVKEKLEAGASLVQVWTGFIYVGPAIVKKICRN
jgi:dihydroorotate dehydrogenase